MRRQLRVDEYDTPRWAQIILWVLILGGICAPMFASGFRCKYAWHDTQIMCEAYGVDPLPVMWEVTMLNGEVAEREYTVVAYLTLSPTTWREVSLYVTHKGKKTLVGSMYLRIHGHNIQQGERR